MAQTFDANSGQRINTPKPAQGPPGVPNQGAGTGLRQPRTIRPVQPRTRKDEITRPAVGTLKGAAAPSHTDVAGRVASRAGEVAQRAGTAAKGPPGFQPAPMAAPEPGAPMAGAVKTAEQYTGPGGEKISVKQSPEQQEAQAVQGGTQPTTDPSSPQGAVAPPLAPSPLGADSPIEQHAATGRFALGKNAHIRNITQKNLGTMSRDQQIDYERKAVRDFETFGDYEGMNDPNAPPPPINVGGFSFNPETNSWVQPEGYVSVLGRK